MGLHRRTLIVSASAALSAVLTGCGLGRPGPADVERAITGAPGVVAAEVQPGPGGGLSPNIVARFETEVDADDLEATADEAWRRGVEVLHEMYDGARGHLVSVASATATDGTEFSLLDLIDLGDSQHVTLGHFYDRYGIG